MHEPTTDQKPRRILLACIVAPLLSLIFVLVWTTTLIALVPRRAEGIRQIPDVSWSLYYWLAALVPPIIAILLITIIFKDRWERAIASLIALATSYGLFASVILDLLRKDFVGKF